MRILLSEKVFMLLRGESVDLAAPEGKFAAGGFWSDGGRLAFCQRAASIPMEGDFRSDHSSRKNMVISA